MISDLDVLARVYEIILGWPDNQNAPDDAAIEHQGQLRKDVSISFRSLTKIITDAAGEGLSNDAE